MMAHSVQKPLGPEPMDIVRKLAWEERREFIMIVTPYEKGR